MTEAYDKRVTWAPAGLLYCVFVHSKKDCSYLCMSVSYHKDLPS